MPKALTITGVTIVLALALFLGAYWGAQASPRQATQTTRQSVPDFNVFQRKGELEQLKSQVESLERESRLREEQRRRDTILEWQR